VNAIEFLCVVGQLHVEIHKVEWHGGVVGGQNWRPLNRAYHAGSGVKGKKER